MSIDAFILLATKSNSATPSKVQTQLSATYAIPSSNMLGPKSITAESNDRP